jgi:hypothetical protein
MWKLRVSWFFNCYPVVNTVVVPGSFYFVELLQAW